jgi:hypothetical protein
VSPPPASIPPVAKQAPAAAPVVPQVKPAPELEETIAYKAPPTVPGPDLAATIDLKTPSPEVKKIEIEPELDLEPEPVVAPKPGRPIFTEPAELEVPDAELEASVADLAESDSESSSDESTSDIDAPVYAPAVGILEEPRRFKAAPTAQYSAPVAETRQKNFKEWFMAHKWACIIGIVVSWIVLAGAIRLFHPMPLLRSFNEEMELRKKVQQAMIDAQNGKATDAASKSSSEEKKSDAAK